MGRPKKKTAEKKKTQPKKDPRIEEVYEEEVSFMCPIRGLVKQKVKVKKFKPLDQQSTGLSTSPIDKLTAQLEESDDGMSMYSEGEELGLTDTGGEE